jgi:hypothetical protein
MNYNFFLRAEWIIIYGRQAIQPKKRKHMCKYVMHADPHVHLHIHIYYMHVSFFFGYIAYLPCSPITDYMLLSLSNWSPIYKFMHFLKRLLGSRVPKWANNKVVRRLQLWSGSAWDNYRWPKLCHAHAEATSAGKPPALHKVTPRFF